MANPINKIVDELPKLPGKPVNPNKPAGTPTEPVVLPPVALEVVEAAKAELIASRVKKNITPVPTVPPVVDDGKTKPVRRTDFPWHVKCTGKVEAPVITQELLPIESTVTPK